MMASDYKPNSEGANLSSTPPILLLSCLYWFHCTVLLYLHVCSGALHITGMYLAQKTPPQSLSPVILPAASKMRAGGCW